MYYSLAIRVLNADWPTEPAGSMRVRHLFGRSRILARSLRDTRATRLCRSYFTISRLQYKNVLYSNVATTKLKLVATLGRRETVPIDNKERRYQIEIASTPLRDG